MVLRSKGFLLIFCIVFVLIDRYFLFFFWHCSNRNMLLKLSLGNYYCFLHRLIHCLENECVIHPILDMVIIPISSDSLTISIPDYSMAGIQDVKLREIDTEIEYQKSTVTTNLDWKLIQINILYSVYRCWMVSTDIRLLWRLRATCLWSILIFHSRQLCISFKNSNKTFLIIFKLMVSTIPNFCTNKLCWTA